MYRLLTEHLGPDGVEALDELLLQPITVEDRDRLEATLAYVQGVMSGAG